MTNMVRLEMWRDALAALPDNRFNISRWATFSDDNITDGWDAGPYNIEDMAVRTVCAGGLACMIPEFNAQGLKLEYISFHCRHMFAPTYQGAQFTRAIARFFDITIEAAKFLTAPQSYTTCKTTRISKDWVLHRLTEFIEANRELNRIVSEPQLDRCYDRSA